MLMIEPYIDLSEFNKSAQKLNPVQSKIVMDT